MKKNLSEDLIKEEYLLKYVELQNIFKNKFKMYGDTLNLFRRNSLTDQILIKVRRVIKLQESNVINVEDESILDTIDSIINYSLYALYKEEQKKIENPKTEFENNFELCDYICSQIDLIIENCLTTLILKNRDYDNSWYYLRNESIIDLIYIKINRNINIENNNPSGLTEYRDNYIDIINYCFLFFIKNKLT